MPRDDTSSQPLQPPGCEPDYDDNGVDRSVVRWFRSLTPTQRLRYAQRQAAKIQAIRQRNGID